MCARSKEDKLAKNEDQSVMKLYDFVYWPIARNMHLSDQPTDNSTYFSVSYSGYRADGAINSTHSINHVFAMILSTVSHRIKIGKIAVRDALLLKLTLKGHGPASRC